MEQLWWTAGNRAKELEALGRISPAFRAVYYPVAGRPQLLEMLSAKFTDRGATAMTDESIHREDRLQLEKALERAGDRCFKATVLRFLMEQRGSGSYRSRMHSEEAISTLLAILDTPSDAEAKAELFLEVDRLPYEGYLCCECTHLPGLGGMRYMDAFYLGADRCERGERARDMRDTLRAHPNANLPGVYGPVLCALSACVPLLLGGVYHMNADFDESALGSVELRALVASKIVGARKNT
jgi:hypothetical protein